MIVFGFALMTLGVALLFLGEVPFVAGKRIPAVRARLIGGVLVGLLPAAWLVKILCDAVFGYDTVEGPVVAALMFSAGCLVTIVILFRVMVPKGAPRKPAAAKDSVSKKNPFGDVAPAASEPVAPAPVNPPPRKKSRKAAASEDNPFDFG
jgi:hypothetical protein